MNFTCKEEIEGNLSFLDLDLNITKNAGYRLKLEIST